MASVGFRWLDILEKEFDKAFVDLDLAIGELEPEEPDIVYNVRQKLCTLSSCFAQLTHKAQTIFQNSAKIEAELIHMRTELAESKSKREILEQELHNLLLQLHTIQLSQLPALTNGTYKQDQPDINSIKKKFEDELKKSPSHTVGNPIESEELKFNPAMLELSQLKHEKAQLEVENAALRNSILALNSEVYGAKLAAKYLDKELAGRIQQLQLLGREMRCDVRDKLWRQLESEILLQRHKTVVRECRRNSVMSNTESTKIKPPEAPTITENGENFGDIRTVVVKRKPTQGLGISITGGREHGVPILISELEANGPAALCGQLYIGDAILSIDDTDLRHACHNYAVEVLKQPSEESRLQVQYVAADDSDNSLEEDGYNFRIFDRDVVSPTDSVSLHPLSTTGMSKTPTAPRTPDSSSQCGNRVADGFLLPDAPNLYNETFIIDMGRTDISNSVVPTETNLIILDTTEPCADTASTNFVKAATSKLMDVHLKKLSNLNDDLHCSTNSLISENLSSPMQTSTDMFLDSEILSTDSQSPKNLEKKQESLFCDFPVYGKNAYRSSSSTKSDQSLLNSADSCESSPIHKANRDYKKVQRRYKPKKYFGVKTLQSIFSKHGGYSDVSTSPSDCGDEPVIPNPPESCYKEIGTESESQNGNLIEIDTNKNNVIPVPETSQQFEDNIHNILSEMFCRNFDIQKLDATQTNKNMRKSLRVGKALRLCPNEDTAYAQLDNEQKREKLLARYVYNANCLNGEGVGDPDFGTPV